MGMQHSAKPTIPGAPRLREHVVIGRGLFRPHSSADGLWGRVTLARNVPKDIKVNMVAPRLAHMISKCCTRHLKPRSGYLEQVEIDLEPRCDDGEVPDIMKKWYGWLNDATTRGSKSIQYVHQTTQLLQAQGFVDIKETVIRLPFNTWPQDRHEKSVGRWYNLGLCEGLEAISLGPFTRVFQWPAADVRRLCEEMKQSICNRNFHVYNNL